MKKLVLSVVATAGITLLASCTTTTANTGYYPVSRATYYPAPVVYGGAYPYATTPRYYGTRYYGYGQPRYYRGYQRGGWGHGAGWGHGVRR